MVEITMEYLGDYQIKSIHNLSGAQITTDAPLDNQGKGRSFSPTDLVATALGSCMATIMAIAAGKKSLDLGKMKVVVQKEMAAKPARRIGKLTVEIEVPNPISPENQKMLENAAKTCPVHHSLHPDVEVTVSFKWA
jgi:putative redox protein